MAEQLLGAYMKNRMGALAENDVFSGGMMLIVIGLVGAYLHWIWQMACERVQRQFVVSLEVRKEDEAFHWLMKWLAVQTERTNGRELSMLTTRENRRDRWEGAEAATKPQLQFGPAPGLHLLRFRGRWVTVERTIKENQFGGGNGGLELQETLKLTTYGRDPQILKDMAANAMNDALGEELGKTLIFQPKYGWTGTWRKLMAIERRAIESVHFPKGTLERLLEDVREFFAMREWYRRRGIPHRRGLLLYGPPGNGKSSFAAALAGELGLNLCVCSLANASLDDDELQEFMRKMPKGSILLLEDVDAAFVHRKKNNSESGNKVTFSGLLNALDGAVAFEGSLVLMTTNHREKLDPALTRPGRVDFALHVGLANRDQIERLFAYFYQPWEAAAEVEKADAEAEADTKRIAARKEDVERDRKRANRMASEFARLVPDEQVSMASIQGYLLRFKLDPQGAIDNVAEFVAEEQARMRDAEVRRKKEVDDEARELRDQEEKEAREKKKNEDSSSSSSTDATTQSEVAAKEAEEKRASDVAVVSA
jgi:chaperone BCS1